VAGYLIVELEMGEMNDSCLEINVQLRQVELLLQKVPKGLVQKKLKRGGWGKRECND
jgi:hypothetical protein